jgi:hypothetical protein
MELMCAAGATGVLLGLWFRVQALIVVSAAAVTLWLVTAPLAEYGLLWTVAMMALLLGLLQTGYLAGLFIQHAWSWRGSARTGYDQLQAAARAFYCGVRAR